MQNSNALFNAETFNSSNTAMLSQPHLNHLCEPPNATEASPGGDEAYEFLKALDAEAIEFTFQTFFDPEKPSKGERANANHSNVAKILHGSLEDCEQQLIELNQRQAGVFVAVQETDLQGRKAENITAIRTIYADFDDGLPETLPLEPSIIVESSPKKYQYYWLCSDISREEFAHVMQRLIKDYGADRRAKDVARVLRLPGFFHQKSQPFRVRLQQAKGTKYTRQQILDAFPPMETAAIKQDVRTCAQQTQGERPSVSEIESALKFIPADEYEVWRNIGFALHDHFSGSQEGHKIWHDWSAKSPNKFDPNACWKLWFQANSERNEKITIATLFSLARGYGWMPSVTLDVVPEHNKDGAPKYNSQSNLRAALEKLNITLSYDEFSKSYFANSKGIKNSEIDDDLMRELFFEIDALGVKCGNNYFHNFILNEAKKHSFHSVKRYLDSLVWDDTPRLNAFLVKYCGATDTELHQEIGSIFFKAAVSRIYKPGCKFDNLLVLEGSQGLGKSSIPHILAGPTWFTDCACLGDDPKTLLEQTSGKWIVEIAELSGWKRREAEVIKSMLSRTEDVARRAYDRTTSKVPRQFILIGTTNSTNYLMDDTGNRRYWCVRVDKIDQEGLKRDRDQLWAEAVHRFRSGESIQLPKHLWIAASEAQNARRLIDPHEETLKDALEGIYGIVPVNALYEVLGIAASQRSNRKMSHSSLISRVMEQDGWTKSRRRNPSLGNRDNRETVWERTDPKCPDTIIWWKYNECTGRLDAGPSLTTKVEPELAEFFADPDL